MSSFLYFLDEFSDWQTTKIAGMLLTDVDYIYRRNTVTARRRNAPATHPHPDPFPKVLSTIDGNVNLDSKNVAIMHAF